MSVKIGDVVLFKKYGPDEVELDGKKYLVEMRTTFSRCSNKHKRQVSGVKKFFSYLTLDT